MSDFSLTDSVFDFSFDLDLDLDFLIDRRDDRCSLSFISDFRFEDRELLFSESLLDSLSFFLELPFSLSFFLLAPCFLCDSSCFVL